jgi:hypothetical protein
MESAKSMPNRSAFCTIVLFSSKLGRYCGEVVEVIQPLLLMGMKTPLCMARTLSPRVRLGCSAAIRVPAARLAREPGSASHPRNKQETLAC